MMSPISFLVIISILNGVFSDKTVHFVEKFDDSDAYKQRWVESTFKGAEQGPFKLTHGKFYGDAEADIGLQTTQDARFYGLSAKFEPYSNEGKSLVIQFSVKHEQKIDCGGGYVKLYPKGI
jgi:calreticulin